MRGDLLGLVRLVMVRLVREKVGLVVVFIDLS
jgi:hypothetical protein